MSATTTTKKPSLYARKLVEKLRTLNSNASLESRQTIANWMVFNRKKAEGMGEGLLLAITDGTASSSSTEASSPLRLLLLLRVLHQVFVEGKDDSDVFEKSSQLRSILADVALIPLFKALANSIGSSSEQTENYQNEVREMIESWKEYNVFDGPTVWEGYKKAWGRALADTKEKKNTTAVGETSADVDSATSNTIEPKDVVVGGRQSTEEGAQQTPPTTTTTSSSSSSTKEIDESNKTSSQIIIDTSKDATKEEYSTASKVAAEPIPSTATNEEEEEAEVVVDNNKEPDRRFSKRDSLASVASIDIDFDAEGVEEAEVEPAKFLEASKVIASLQIARDLGSDAAMNLSSALGSVPAEVEQACNTIYAQQQQEGGEEGTTSIEELLSTDQLSNLPDEILDIDLDYARKSLHTYREAILQQRKARLQCLHLLLQSRCSFGSLDAARAFGCDDGSNEGMDIILEQLKKMKEKLIDAMALEGLDVEEDDADEKKMKEEEEQLKPLSWFPGQTKESEEEPASKRQKVA